MLDGLTEGQHDPSVLHPAGLQAGTPLLAGWQREPSRARQAAALVPAGRTDGGETVRTAAAALPAGAALLHSNVSKARISNTSNSFSPDA